ncbi:MAG: segregation/condensation protein A [Neisseriaceae bacterium]|nr:segregation/condensation protein A [Neisseriaceae bacterium]
MKSMSTVEPAVFELLPPVLPAGLPIAHVFGQAVFVAPDDLFIPPDALQVILGSFEGPLDLLLYLIRKQNIDILNLPMAEITRQYLAYIDWMSGLNLSLTAEYLLMAALLLQIKSRLLLPIMARTDEDIENEDPRLELAHRLLAYEQMKLAAQALDDLPWAERNFFWAGVGGLPEGEPTLPRLELMLLTQAWQAISLRVRQTQHHEIKREKLTVHQQMQLIVTMLAAKSPAYLLLEDFFDLDSHANYVVTTFLAVLELCKERRIAISQSQPYAPVALRLI